MTYHLTFDIDFKRNTYPGMFVAFEGIDASGKTTQVEQIAYELRKKGRTVIVKNPFEGEIGEFVRKILSGEKKLPLVALQYLVSANRQVQQEEIIKQLQNGVDVIIDRYFWSAVAYGVLDKGGTDYKTNMNWLLVEQSILSMYHQFLLPDFTFYLRVTSEVAVSRLSHMDKQKEIYEDKEKIKQVVGAYQLIIDSFPAEFIVINGEQQVGKISEEILKHIEKEK